MEAALRGLMETKPASQLHRAGPSHEADRERIGALLAALAVHQDALCARFYERFFAQHPETRPLFGEHSESEREEMLNETLASLLAWCDGEPWLRDNLEALGASHWEYGVLDDMYDAFRTTFLAAAREVLTDEWDDARGRALDGALQAVCACMRDAGARARERSLARRRQRRPPGMG